MFELCLLRFCMTAGSVSCYTDCAATEIPQTTQTYKEFIIISSFSMINLNPFHTICIYHIGMHLVFC